MYIKNAEASWFSAPANLYQNPYLKSSVKTIHNVLKGELDVYDVHRRIDELVPDHLTRFVEARSSIANAFGLQGYADVMSHFAAGERYLNRVWSASADGYIDEVRGYLGRAEAQFVEARDLLRRLERR